jgi:3-methyladenine DNA glycosylase AlkD
MSEASAKADAFVSTHLDAAVALGNHLSDLTEEPDAFVAALRAGLETLTDPAHLASITRACPATPAVYAVRRPLAEAVMKPVRRSLRETSSISALRLGQRLAQAEHRDLRLYALPALHRALAQDPELAWQVMRQMGRSAGDWIAVDSLADVWARGVLAEPFRWAELEQLMYSRHTMERRLVAATLATLPHRVPAGRRHELRPTASQRALDLLRQLMGDAEVMVQKAMSWALREWTRVDAERVAAMLRTETTIAVQRGDGARAWVIRDALSSQSPEIAAELRTRLGGLRRSAHRTSTSIAAEQAASFAEALTRSTDAVAAQGERYTRSRT